MNTDGTGNIVEVSGKIIINCKNQFEQIDYNSRHNKLVIHCTTCKPITGHKSVLNNNLLNVT